MQRRPRLPTPRVPLPAPGAARHLPPVARGAVCGAAGGKRMGGPYVSIHCGTDRLSHSIPEAAFVEPPIVNVAPETVSGPTVRFHVAENDRVEQGQVLA